MIYKQNCYNLNVKYFDNLIEININKCWSHIAPFSRLYLEN